MSSSTRIRILAVDDHPIVREGIAALIAIQPDMILVAQTIGKRYSAVIGFSSHADAKRAATLIKKAASRK